MATVLTAFRDERQAAAATNGHRPARTPLAVSLARWMARRLPRLAAVRRILMHVAGLACGCGAAYVWWGLGALLAAMAVSFITLDLIAGRPPGP